MPTCVTVLEQDADVVALQEVTIGNYSDWCRGLTRVGYSVLSTVDLVALAYPPPPYPSPPFPPRCEGGRDQIRRTNFNLLAARHPIAALPRLSFPDPDEARFGFPEKFVAARVAIAGLEVDVHNAHVPPGASRGVLKVHAFEAIRWRLDEQPDRPRVLCGDFNAPWDEDGDGPLIEPRRNWPEEIRQRWVEAERAIVANPELTDVYRDVLRPGQPFPASHFTGRGRSLTTSFTSVRADRPASTVRVARRSQCHARGRTAALTACPFAARMLVSRTIPAVVCRARLDSRRPLSVSTASMSP